MPKHFIDENKTLFSFQLLGLIVDHEMERLCQFSIYRRYLLPATALLTTRCNQYPQREGIDVQMNQGHGIDEDPWHREHVNIEDVSQRQPLSYSLPCGTYLVPIEPHVLLSDCPSMVKAAPQRGRRSSI